MRTAKGQWGNGLGWGLTVGVFLGAVIWARGATPRADTSDVVRAHRFELIGEDGNTRAVLLADKEEAALRFYDSHGKERVWLAVREGEIKETIFMLDSAAQETQVAMLADERSSSLYLRGDVKRIGLNQPPLSSNAVLRADESGHAELSLGKTETVGGDLANMHDFVRLYGSIDEGAKLALAGNTHGVFHERTEEEAGVDLYGRGGTLHWSTAKAGIPPKPSQRKRPRSNQPKR